MQRLRLAMIGCGRAAESLHLPAAALCPGIETTVLVDTDADRARSLAASYGVSEVRERAAEVAGLADAAIVALPHHLHAPLARELLEAGLHVLVEKPLAFTAQECHDLAVTAEERGLTLAVGMIRRSFPAARFVRQAVECDLLGTIEAVEVSEGAPYRWEVASDFTFRPETGGGTLADTGVHVLDLLSWWFGEPSVTAYRDDAAGGVEAECEIELALGSGTPIRVELSRTRELSNSVSLFGRRGRLVAGIGFAADVTLDLGGVPLVGAAQPDGAGYRNVRELFIEQLEAFAQAVGGAPAPVVGGHEAARAVGLLERCREHREPLSLPWAQTPIVVPA